MARSNWEGYDRVCGYQVASLLSARLRCTDQSEVVIQMLECLLLLYATPHNIHYTEVLVSSHATSYEVVASANYLIDAINGGSLG